MAKDQKVAFKRHPQAVALDKWLESEDGRKCLSPGAHGQYLRNRLMRAFQAGWDAHEEHTGPKRSGRAGVPEDDGLEMSGDVQRWRPSKGDINKIKMEVSPTGKYVRYADFLAAHHRAVQPPSAWPFRKSP
jgi:hypothetical protein